MSLECDGGIGVLWFLRAADQARAPGPFPAAARLTTALWTAESTDARLSLTGAP